MLPELAHLCLILAFVFALSQGLMGLLAPLPRFHVWQGFIKPLSITVAVFIGLSYIGLSLLFNINDFSVTYVAAHSNSLLPWYYRLSAVWGAHEGSLLLWITLLALWQIAVVVKSRDYAPAFFSRVMAVMGWIIAGFILFILATSNPFARLLPMIPKEGADLTPLLQDLGLLIHPPMLYMGYVGFAVAFAFAIAALLEGKLDSQTWTKQVRPFVLLAWCFLTFGITLGSWWSYHVLGWGGWWFWDPVENASFLPWLVGTALIHTLMVTEKQNLFKAWTVLLAILAFALSLLGTFLVRSGVLISVHTFANDSARGFYLLLFLLIVLVISLTLFAVRAPRLSTEGDFSLCSRETLLLFNNLLLVIAMVTILLGTLYPLILDAMLAEKISVGPPYFNKVFVPIALFIMFVMGLAPFIRWGITAIKPLGKQLMVPASVSVFVFIALLFAGGSIQHAFTALLGIVFSAWIITTLACNIWQRKQVSGGFRALLEKSSNRYWGMCLAHFGIAICALGISLNTTLSLEKQVRLSPGQKVMLGQYSIDFKAVTPFKGPNYRGDMGLFTLSQGNQQIAELKPEKRLYLAQNIPLNRAAINRSFFADIYIVLGEPLAEHPNAHTPWAVHVYYKPFVAWIWLGGILMLFGGLIAVPKKRMQKQHQSQVSSETTTMESKL